jgi:opacity protein-like surface antigen
MRQFFLALAVSLAAAPAASALDVSFSAGSALTVVGGYAQATPLAAQFGITNTGSQDLTLGLERQILSEISGSENNFCFGVGCYPPNVSLSPQPITLTAGSTDNSFVGDYSPNGYAGITRIRYAIYDINGLGVAADTAYVTVTYDASQRVTGLAADLAKSNLLDAPAPNPAVAGNDVMLSVAPATGATAIRLVDLRNGRTIRTVELAAGFINRCPTPALTTTTSGCCAPGASCCTPGASCCAGGSSSSAVSRTSPVTTVRLTTQGIAPGVYGCMLIGSNGQPRAMRRLVIQ